MSGDQFTLSDIVAIAPLIASVIAIMAAFISAGVALRINRKLIQMEKIKLTGEKYLEIRYSKLSELNVLVATFSSELIQLQRFVNTILEHHDNNRDLAWSDIVTSLAKMHNVPASEFERMDMDKRCAMKDGDKLIFFSDSLLSKYFNRLPETRQSITSFITLNSFFLPDKLDQNELIHDPSKDFYKDKETLFNFVENVNIESLVANLNNFIKSSIFQPAELGLNQI